MIPIDIRDSRLRGGRLHISSRTTNRKLAQRREAALRSLLDRNETDILDRLRSRQLRIENIAAAVEAQNLDLLRRQAEGTLRLGEALKRTLKTVKATSVDAPRTLEAYQTLERQLLAWLGKDYDLSSLTSAEAEEWLHAPKPTNDHQPWSAARQQGMRTLAARIWAEAIKREVEAADKAKVKPRMTINPWSGVNLPKVRASRAAYLQPQEWRTLLDVVRGTPKALAFGLGALAGLRRGEICHLRTGIDVDTDARVIHVQPRKGEWPWRPKTDRGIRTLDISDELLALVAEHGPFAGERYLIHPADGDRPMHGVTMRHWAAAAFPAAGLRYGLEGDGLTMHSLRHTFASWAVQDGVSPMIVADLLGDTLEMVVRVYGHLAPRNYRQAMEAVGRVSRV